MREVIRILSLILVLLSPTSNFAKEVTETITEAKHYLLLKPAISLELITGIKKTLAESNIQTRLDGYMIGLWASIYLLEQEKISNYFGLLRELSQVNPELINAFPIMRSYTSILWRIGSYEEAKQLAICAAQKTSSHSQLEAITLSLGIILRQQGELESANRINDFGYALAKKQQNKRYIPPFLNNKALIALQEKDFVTAETLLTKALDISYETAHLTGQVISGLNLMLTYLIKHDWDKFERMTLRLERLSALQESESYASFYQWLILAAQKRRAIHLQAPTDAELNDVFDKISNHGIQTFISNVAPELGINVQYVKPEIDSHDDLFKDLFNGCNWQEIEKQTFSETLLMLAEQVTKTS